MNKHRNLSLVPILGVALALTFAVPASSGPGYISVHPSAFQPSDGGATGWYLQRESLANNASSESIFFAPVYLPQGATVTKLTLRFVDPEDGPNGTLTLERIQSNGSHSTLAEVSTLGYAGTTWEWPDETIDNAVVDNSQYIYYLRWNVPAGLGIQLRGAIIEYTYTTSLPAILRNLQSPLGRQR